MEPADGLRDHIRESLESLPDEKVREVADFVEFLQERTIQGEDPVLRVSGTLEGSSLSSQDIDDALYGEDSV